MRSRISSLRREILGQRQHFYLAEWDDNLGRHRPTEPTDAMRHPERSYRPVIGVRRLWLLYLSHNTIPHTNEVLTQG